MFMDKATGEIVVPGGAALFKSANGLGGGDGTVTTVSIVSANGITGTVETATTTPAITLDASAAIDAAVSTAVAALEAEIASIEVVIDTQRWEPVTNGDVDNPEILFAGGDVVMQLVET